jgi:hypothetical protein
MTPRKRIANPEIALSIVIPTSLLRLLNHLSRIFVFPECYEF